MWLTKEKTQLASEPNQPSVVEIIEILDPGGGGGVENNCPPSKKNNCLH